MEKYGFQYDSSIFPIKTMLYGEPNAPLGIYKPSKEDVTQNDSKGNVIEYPMTVLRFGTNIPIAGGFYMRILPFWLLKHGIKIVNIKRPAIVYVHPWEFNPNTPRLDLQLFPRIVTYYGINSNLRKLNKLLNLFEFTSIKDILEL